MIICIIFDFTMALIFFLFGIAFYKSEGKAVKFLAGYKEKSEDERKKYDENAMCKSYGKRMIFMSLPFLLGILIDIQYPGTGTFMIYTFPMNYAKMTGLPCRVVA